MKVLIIGDSISMGYTPTVARELADVATVEHNPDNGGDSSDVVANIDAWLSEARADVVTLNCGLHDIKRERDTGHCQVPLDFYKLILPAILEKIRSAGCRALWVNTTPVIEERQRAAQSFDRLNIDVDTYNAVARKMTKEAGVPIINLHRAAQDLGLEEALIEDGVHFTPEAYEQLGKKVAARLRRELK